jgi:hypothetical protein
MGEPAIRAQKAQITLPRDAPLHALERANSTKGNRATTRADEGTIALTLQASKPLIFIPPAAGSAGIWLLTFPNAHGILLMRITNPHYFTTPS